MTVEYKNTDLFSTNAKIIAHGCNCEGEMGAGVALIVRKNFPNVFNAYRDKFEQFGLELGEVQLVPASNANVFFANCMTQQTTGTHRRQVNYEAVFTCFEQLEVMASNNKFDIAIPKIGSGYAGGSWNIVDAMLKEVFDKSNTLVTVHSID